MKKLYFILPIMFSAVISCKKGSFSGQSSVASGAIEQPGSGDVNGRTSGDGNPDGSDQASTLTDSQSFNLELRETELDIVWVIDNSASMAQEAQQVRNNFDGFINSINQQASLKLALISLDQPTLNTSVTLSDQAKAAGHTQLDIRVGSTNMLAIAAAASCDAAMTNLIQGEQTRNGTLHIGAGSSICGASSFSFSAEPPRYASQDIAGDFLEGYAAVEAAKGGLKSFFRPDSSKVFVFVSDDEAETINGANFLSSLENDAGKIKPIVYSFSGLSSSSCAIARAGAAFTSLSQVTGGQSFDICQQDWSNQFSELQSAIVKKANAQFTIEKEPNPESIQVKFNDKLLEAGEFSVNGRVITIEESILSDATEKDSITIDYEAI